MAAPIGPKKIHRNAIQFKIQAVRSSLHPEVQTQDVADALTHSCSRSGRMTTAKASSSRRPRSKPVSAVPPNSNLLACIPGASST